MLILTNTDLANRALNAIGAGSINNIEDTTKPATLCRAYIPQATEDILTENIYPRTVSTTTLLNSDSDFTDWSYMCPLPSDYVRGVRLVDNDGIDFDYEIVGQYLYTDADRPFLFYISSVVDWAVVGSRLAQAVALRLAELICSELTPDQNIKMRIIQEAHQAKTRAVNQAENERYPVRRRPISWGEGII